MATRSIITGQTTGTVESTAFSGNPLTAYLESMSFTNAAGEPFMPSQGITRFEYLTYLDDEWREFDTAARNDYGDGVNYPSRVSGKLIRKVRVTFTGFPADTNFVCRLYLSPIADGSEDARVLGGDQAYTVQPFTEANCKDGVQYYKNININALAANGSRWIIFDTGNKDVLVKSEVLTTNNELASFQLYTGTQYTGGTPLTPRNYNRRDTAPVALSSVVDNATVAGGSEGTAESDEFRAVGSETVGGRSSGSPRTNNIEFVLKKNTRYAWCVRNRSATNALEADFYWTWYEGVISVDI